MTNIAKFLEGAEKGAVAEAAGISRTFLWEIETGKKEPGVRIAAKLLSTLNSPEHLARLNRTDPITFEELFSEEAA